MAVSNVLKFEFKDDLDKKVAKTFKYACGKDDLDTVKVQAAAEAMVDNAEIFAKNLASATAAALVVTETVAISL